MLKAVYKKRCLRCLGDITSIRLSNGEFCDRCLEELKTSNEWLYFEKYAKANEKLKEFEEFVKKHTGNSLTSLQKMWAKRFFLGESFSLLAPTGIGKSTFGIFLAAFVKKSYILVPTKLLVNQVKERLKEFNVLAYSGKKEQKEKIKNKEYDILVTTTQFFYKNRDLVGRDFNFIFVDDVDSVLKSSKRINDILYLAGFDEEDIKRAFESVESRNYEELEEIKKKKRANLIVSSATANPKSKRVKLFKYLLGFEVSKPSFTLRNIEDLYDEEFSWKKSVEWIKKLGRGGLLFLPGNETKEKLKEYIDFLLQHSIKAYSYEEFNDYLEEFKEGKAYFVGFASYRNPLARGIDLPEHVRYTLFVGVPKIEFRVDDDNLKSLYFAALSIYSFGIKDSKFKEAVNFMKKYIFYSLLHPKVEEKLKKYAEFIREFIQKHKEKIKELNEVGFDGEKIITADITGYIQASGRSSRFYKGHLTKGLSLVLVDDKKAFFSLKKKLKWFSLIELKDAKDVDLEVILKEIDKSREVEERSEFKTTFVIVESPTKAKTIASFFGKGSNRIVNGVLVYEVLLKDRVLIITASIGHDFDLVEDEGVWGVIDKWVPIFRVLENKEKILEALNLTSSEVDEVLIATDPDREGEKIAFDLLLNNKILNTNIKRAEFHEITKSAFLDAINNLRDINQNLVASQFVRRIADRWVGFKISEYLQKRLNNPTLSAGRVQTPVLRWICKRGEKLKEKVLVVEVRVGDGKFEFEVEDSNLDKFLEKVKSAPLLKVDSYEEELVQKPFNTSELLKEASIKLKFSPQKTMKLLQELFERGFITYHRTDSHRISDVGIYIAKEYIKEKFSKEYIEPKKFEEKGAHEAIRATMPFDKEQLEEYLITKNIELSNEHLRLYDLIFRRFIASQMRRVKVLKEKFELLTKQEEFITKILKDGFNLIYPVRVFNIEDKREIKSYKKSKVSPFTYAEIIETMKNKNIGRPSTYAITIEKLLQRGYIVQKRDYIFATKLGFRVIDIIDNSEYKEFVSEDFTALLEEKMDKIEKGEIDYKEELIKLFSLLF